MATTKSPAEQLKPGKLLTLAQVEYAQGNFMDARAFIQRRDAMGSNAEVLELAARIEDGAGDQRAAARYRGLPLPGVDHLPAGLPR